MEERRRAKIGRARMFDAKGQVTFAEALTPYLVSSWAFGAGVGGAYGATLALSNARLYNTWRTRLDATFLSATRHGWRTANACLLAAPVVLGAAASVHGVASYAKSKTAPSRSGSGE